MWNCPTCVLNIYSATCHQCGMTEREALLRAVSFVEEMPQPQNAYRARKRKPKGYSGILPTHPKVLSGNLASPSQNTTRSRAQILRSTRNVIVVNLVLLTGLLLRRFLYPGSIGSRQPQPTQDTRTAHWPGTCLSDYSIGLQEFGAGSGQFTPPLPTPRFSASRWQAEGILPTNWHLLKTELANAESFGSIRLTTQWLLRPRFFGFDLVPLVDLAWGTMLIQDTYTLVFFVPIDRNRRPKGSFFTT